MDNYILIGKFINTFGIKGELKLFSDFEYLDLVLKNGFSLYIGKDKTKEVITNYRIHKNYPMILLSEYTNINEVLKYKGEKVYIKREDLNLGEDEYLLSDLIGYKVYDNELLLGVVIDYEKNSASTLLKVMGDKKFYLPLIDQYILDVSTKEKKILTNNGKELIL